MIKAVRPFEQTSEDTPEVNWIDTESEDEEEEDESRELSSVDESLHKTVEEEDKVDPSWDHEKQKWVFLEKSDSGSDSSSDSDSDSGSETDSGSDSDLKMDSEGILFSANPGVKQAIKGRWNCVECSLRHERCLLAKKVITFLLGALVGSSCFLYAAWGLKK